jgi:hypothetical protein
MPQEMLLIEILVHVTSYIHICVIICLMAYPLGRAVKGVGLQALDCWIAGSNPAGNMDVLVSCVTCSEHSGLYDGLITRAEEFCRVCVCVCVYVFLNVCEVETSKRGVLCPIWVVAPPQKESLLRTV